MTISMQFETPFETYSSIKIIGEGGSGRVYEVKSSSGDLFALKLLASAYVTSEKSRRFKNEINFCQSQRHPNIVKVLDTGSFLSKGVKCPFYVMKRYGATLRDRIGQMDAESSLKAFSNILDGIEAAHLNGVWHRDVKPENVLWDKAENFYVVADFGIAHFEKDEIYTAVETKLASRMANFQYSAPEQRQRGAAVERSADIFALGLVLNELFTSEVPQGTGYARIRDRKPELAYLDELVDGMIQNNPANRPDIREVKNQLIGRKNAFVALQQFEVATKQVVPATKAEEFEPISITGIDYGNGTLTFQLSDKVPAGWSDMFQNPRGGHSGVLGYGPETFVIRGDRMVISVREDQSLIQSIVNYAKSYTAAANAGLVSLRLESAVRQEREARIALEKKVAQAEARKNILANVKL